MKKHVSKIILMLCLAYLYMSCANESNPTGGPRDTTPPKLVSRTVKDSMLRFTGGTVSFAFDEKIESNTIVVETFPLLTQKPKVVVNKKVLSIILPDTLLQKNTTYKISLGTSVKDIYEGNMAQSIDFTFSTGDALDTLSIAGIVKKAATGQPDTGATVLLYPIVESDSDVSIKLPMYAAHVASNGAFVFTNLPPREFFVYAISDGNKNNKYDVGIENIAYLENSILPISKPVPAGIILRTFSEANGTANIKKIVDRMQGLPFSGFTINVDSSNSKLRSFDVTKPITIQSNFKLANLQKNKIRLYTEDSVLDETGVLVWDSIKNTIVLNADLQEDAVYRIELQDSFAIDTTAFLKGKTFVFRTKKKEDFGTLTIACAENFVNDKNNYWILSQNDKTIAKQMITSTATTFGMLLPGNYTLQIFTDDNANGKWDTGKYYGAKKQPEAINQYVGEIIIKGNWVNKIEFK